MKNYFIVHALGNSAVDYWYPWLKQQIENKEYNCYCPTLPPIENMSYNSWEKAFKPYAKNLNSESIVIGHSTGSIFLVHYLLKHKINVAKFIGVVSFNKRNGGCEHQDWNDINETFFVKNLSDFKNFAQVRVCFYSPTDIYDFKILNEFAESVGAKKRIIESAGHFTAVTGYDKKFFEIVEELDL